MLKFRLTNGKDNYRGSSLGEGIYGLNGNDTIFGKGGADLIDGGRGNDKLSGDAGNDTLKGGLGNDKLYGGSGKDKLKGDAGNDLLDGGSSADNLQGGSGNDVLKGGASADVLNGGTGNDTLIGGAGIDRLTGGDGDDKFQLHFNGGADQILDFQGINSPTGDLIVLSASEFNLPASLIGGGLDVTVFHNNGPVFSTPDQRIGYDLSGPSPDLWADKDGSGPLAAVKIGTVVGFAGFGFSASEDFLIIA